MTKTPTPLFPLEKEKGYVPLFQAMSILIRTSRPMNAKIPTTQSPIVIQPFMRVTSDMDSLSLKRYKILL